MRRKTATRIGAVAMAAAMMMGVLAGCGGGGETTPAGGTTAAQGGETTAAQGGETTAAQGGETTAAQGGDETSAEASVNLDFGGAVIRVGGANSNGIWGDLNPGADNENTENQNYKEAWELAHELEAKYNCTIEFVDLEGRDGYNGSELVLSKFTAGGDEIFVDILSVGEDEMLKLRDYLADVTADVNKLQMGSTYIEPATWKGVTYGFTHDDIGSAYVMVYSRDYLTSIGMDVTPTDKFVEGKWSYEDMTAYLTELKAKLPDGIYPIGLHTNHWASMAPAANGTVSVDSQGNIHMAEEAYCEALDYYKELIAAGLACPIENAKQNDDGSVSAEQVAGPGGIAGLSSEGKTYVIGMAEAWQMEGLGDSLGDWGIVPWPWGSNVTCSGDYTTLENYLVPQSIWTNLVIPKAEYRNAATRSFSDIDLLLLASEWCKLKSPAGAKIRKEAWDAEQAGQSYENKGYNAGKDRAFCQDIDIEIYDWLHSRSVLDWGHAMVENGVINVNRNAALVIALGQDSRATGESWQKAGEQEMANLGLK